MYAGSSGNDERVLFALHDIQSRLPSAIEIQTLTPSEASHGGEGVTKYETLLRGLNLKVPSSLVSTSMPTFVAPNFDIETYVPHWKSSATERTSYQPVRDYLCGLNLHAMLIAEGINLFSCEIHTLRQLPPKQKGQRVLRCLSIHGRSDIAVLTDPPESIDFTITPLQHYMVNYVIEIKKPAASSGYREAIVQLIGLNVNNRGTRPLVILTDLSTVHETFELVISESETGAIVYTIQRRGFAGFHLAVGYAQDVSLQKLSPLTDFCRGMTPVSTPTADFEGDPSEMSD
jgi:hypothetical protein